MLRLPNPARPVQLAGKGMLLLAVGVSYLLNRALAPKPPKPAVDKSSPTFSERGAYIPYVLGRRRVGPVIGWVGDRRAETKSSGGGKGGTKKAKYNVYFEKAWHLLCLGPVERIHAIYASDRVEAGPYARDLGSGVFVSIGDHGASLYFGECEQPINTTLGDASRVGVSSRWPGVAYVEWNERSLGQSPTWPQLEYDVEVRVPYANLAGDSWLDASTAPFAIGTDEEGVNPAHALYYLLTAEHPHGCGISPAVLDNDFLEDLGALCATEHLPVNILAASGQDVVSTIAALLADCGISIPQVGKLLSPRAMREDLGTIPQITKALYQYTTPDITIGNERTAQSRTVYAFANVRNSFAAQDVPIGDDGMEEGRGQRKESTVPLPTITHWDTAQRVIDRREQESLAGAQLYRVTAYRQARLLTPGQVVTFEGLGQLRVLRTRIDTESGDVEVEAMSDIYSKGTAQTPGAEPGYPPTPTDDPPAADKFFHIEEPRELGDGETFRMVALRIPAHEYIVDAVQHISDDGATYQNLGDGSANGFGGILVEEMPESSATITTGPIFYGEGGDPGIVLDLSLATSRHQSGEQVLVSELGEILYPAALVALGGGFYRADNLIRARRGTTPQRHPWGTRICIMPIADVVPQASTLLAVAASIRQKSQPYTTLATFDLASVVPFTRTWQGQTRAPLPVSAVSANTASNEYVTGGSITVNWTATATDQAGNTVPLAEVIVEVLSAAGAVLRTIVEASPVVGADSLVYSNADLVTDFGAEPPFVDLRVLARSGTNRSASITIRVHLDTADQGADHVGILRADTFGPRHVPGMDPSFLEVYASLTPEEFL